MKFIGAVWALICLLYEGCSNPPLPASTARSAPQSRPALRMQELFEHDWPIFKLEADKAWQINIPPGPPFDASALLTTPEGLLTLSDKALGIYRIALDETRSDADLTLLPGVLTAAQLRSAAPIPVERYDIEGLARDSAGRLYVCEESHRWIFRFDPKTGLTERLNIDWAPVQEYFQPNDPNASFEGIALSERILYVANERSSGRIIAVDLESLRIVDHFVARPSNGRTGDVHYSDLCWSSGSLFALLRHHRVVLKIDPAQHRVLAEYDFQRIENDPSLAYQKVLPTGNMEGLAVDERNIWLVTDNNGLPRKRFPADIRPTLVRCRRPDLPN